MKGNVSLRFELGGGVVLEGERTVTECNTSLDQLGCETPCAQTPVSERESPDPIQPLRLQSGTPWSEAALIVDPLRGVSSGAVTERVPSVAAGTYYLIACSRGLRPTETPRERAAVKWTLMKQGPAKWWSDNWPYVIGGGILAVAGFIVANILTGGAILAALPPIMTASARASHSLEGAARLFHPA